MKEKTEALNASISFYLAPATCVRFYKEATILDIYRCITDPKVAKRQTETLRQLTDKDLKAQYKRSAFHYCTFSGSFGENRKNAALRQHSGLICFDFDHIGNVEETKRLLLKDTRFRTVLLFTSPSGDGVKWVIAIDLDRADHLTWFQAVSNYLQATYGLQTDPACKNVARACFIPYDPECYIDSTFLPEVQTLAEENPEVLHLMQTLCATQIKVENNEHAN